MGVDDLFLRDWSKDQILELQGKLSISLYERTILSPLLEVNEARNLLEKTEFTNFLQTRNVRGYKRLGIDSPLPGYHEVVSLL